jgi:hypothetical protein
VKTVRFEGVDHQFPDEATDDEIASALEELSQPAAAPARMGREAQGAFGELPDPVPQRTLGTALFPTASEPQPRTETVRVPRPIPGTMAFDPMDQEEKEVEVSGLERGIRTAGRGAMDLMGAPMRLAAKTRGMEMSDPNAYALRPEMQRLMEIGGYEEGEVPAVALELAGQIASDPVTYAPLIGPVLSAFPKLVKVLGRGAGVLNKGAGRLAEEMSGVSEEALRMAGTKQGREALQASAGKGREIGEDLLSKIENADDFIPERQVVDEALEKMGPIDLGSAVRSLEGARGPAVAGRLSPEKGAANTSIQKYIDFLRGGELPEDLAQGAQDARRIAGEAGLEATAAGAQAGQDAKAAAQATRAQQAAQSKAGKAASGAGKAKRDAQDAFYSWDRRDTKAAIPGAVQEARDAAAKAREAATTARSRVALGEVSQAEADAAQKAAEAAGRHAEVMGAAARLKGGEPRKAIADALAAQGMDKDGIRDILKAAIKRADEVGELPPQTVSAREYRDLRRDLDVPVNWEQEGAGIKNNALKAGRTTMKNELLKKAEESGNPQYAEAMRGWSDKLDKLEKIKDLLGKTGSTRDRRVEQFINNLFGKNSEHKQQLMRDLDDIFGSDITARAKTSQLASQLGDDGTAGWLPQQFTGRALLGYGATSVTGTPLAAPFFASPKIASGFTLKNLTRLEEGLKSAGVALSPKAEKAMAALRKPASEAQKARLASILAAELEAQMPANAIPFHIQRAAEADTEEPARVQKLRAALDRAKDDQTRQKIQAELDKLLGISMKGNP